ncbi:hypothetical protein BSM4216_3823 [Bacillus smithii]|nr:hypothetical protein BSM4216_3823 [Bacillus smithii]
MPFVYTLKRQRIIISLAFFQFTLLKFSCLQEMDVLKIFINDLSNFHS